MTQFHKVSEVWYQDALEPGLWHNDKGLIVNTAALQERETFFEVTRVAVNPAQTATRQTARRV